MAAFLFLLSPAPAFAVCGDGVPERLEQCDDGNLNDGDCCSSSCTLDEFGTQCTDDGNQCTTDFCNGEGSCLHGPREGSCDDGNECTIGEFCNGNGFCQSEGIEQEGTPCNSQALCGGRGACDNFGICQGDPADCDGVGGQCNDATCDVETARCVTTPVEDGTECFGDVGICTQGKCSGGECTFGPRDCSQFADDCNTADCSTDVDGGCFAVPKEDGTSCEDGNFCTVNDSCTRGICFGGGERDCSEFDTQCTTGNCNGDTGSCEPELLPDATTCDDGDACTTGDHCNSGTCAGTAIDCSSAADQCNMGICNGQTGQCQKVPFESPTFCDDGDLCTTGDRCLAGLCIGSATDCSGLDGNCTVGVCNPDTGQCTTATAEDDTPCQDGNACTQKDRCTDGTCAGDSIQCEGDDCNPGVCNPDTGQCEATQAPNNTPCDDGDLCTRDDSCKAGVCRGKDVNCTQPDDPCEVAACDAESGQCVVSSRAPGAACSDGNACTTGDTCDEGGTCSGDPVVCSPSTNPCATNQCNANSGQCQPVPVENGQECSDGSLCTTSDQCTNGVCGGTAVACEPTGNPCETNACNPSTGQCVVSGGGEGDPCNDGNPCTTNDTCDGGQCSGTPVVCAPTGNPCTTSQCALRTGQCVVTDVEDGTTCSDGNLCTTGDQCAAGVCGGSPVVCTPPNDPCRTNTCSASTGQCTAGNATDGTTCTDGDLCTTGDQCTAGACGGSPVVCTPPPGGCQTSTCNPDTGQCVAGEGNENGPCNDGNACTTGDVCTNGVCAGTAVACTQLDGACVVGTCNAQSGQCEALPRTNGTPCSDGNACTTGDACSAGTCAAGTAVDCSGVADQCNDGVCDAATGACTRVAKTGTVACNDGAFCTATDACQAGACIGSGNPCAGQPECSNVCNEGSDTCAVAAGTACTSDGNVCTDDACDGEGSCVHEPNDGSCDDGLFCTSNDRCEDGQCVGDPTCPPTHACGDTCSEEDDACRTCGHPFRETRCIVNAVFVLQGALGLRACDLCTCDVDSSGTVTATDALMILRTCANLPTQLECPSPTTTTTIGL